MKKLLKFLFVLFSCCNLASQDLKFIPSSDGYGINDVADDKALQPFFKDNLYIYCSTHKLTSTSPITKRGCIVRVDISNGEKYVFPDDVYLPAKNGYNAKKINNNIVFKFGNWLAKIDTKTNKLTIISNNVDVFDVFDHYAIYDADQSPYTTRIVDLNTNVSTELLSPNNKKLYRLGATYYYNGALYFRSQYITSGVYYGIYKYVPFTKTITEIVGRNVVSGSEIYQNRDEITKVNDNIIFLMKDTDYKLKYFSVNLNTQSLNTSFTFDNKVIYDNAVSDLMIFNNTVYLTAGGKVYTSDGVSIPIESNYPTFLNNGNIDSVGDVLYFNNMAFLQLNTPEYGYEIWKYDGTLKDKELVKDITPGAESSFAINKNGFINNNRIIYTVNKGSLAYSFYVTDGTSEGTSCILNNFNYLSFTDLFFEGDTIYFYGDNGINRGLYSLNYKLGLPSPLNATINQTNLVCIGDNTGQASVTISGGNSPYTYEWSNGKTTASISGLTEGTYSCKITDANSTTLTKNFTIITEDAQSPTIIAPESITVNITSGCTATGITLATPVTADNCSVASINNNAPTAYPLGNTTVTWTVKDASNNTATATQIVTVIDVTKPTIVAPPTVIVNADSNGTATGVILGTPVTADNCSLTSVTNNVPTTFPLGNTTVTWTVKDASNNTATATQIVTVKDATPPTLIPVANFTASTTAINTNESINFKDNSTNTPTSWAWEITKIGSTTLTSSLQNPAFTFVDAGTYTVKLTATNGAGSNTKTVTNMITVFISLPSNNFTIQSKGETCLNENNGEINITAKANYNYVADINGTKYPLVNNSLTVSNLAPTVYNVSITITGELFEQNFAVTIPKGATITAKSTVSSRLASVEILEGTAPYTVLVNGEEQFETTSDTFSVGVNKGDFLEVKTAKACEGIYLKEIDTDLLESVLAHPNPTNGKFEIEIPISIKEIVIDLYTMDSKIISKETYTPINGRIPINLENQASGVYIAKIYLAQPKYLKIIKK